ncbi:cytochrome c/c1 heme-lyase [Cokeromyces recurvatus]|uniref:cytochrome c/c1 heme-lyase n=1 Tax=Cokeromyces recurvatus TaxID=90255 RepID=UPI00222061C0|nr:cytochrome c/c1 heme-lyase [Cokeromyces recurvatus]KAI7899893.1 cytochrome c/c1 heme-lyase [Cokeromyces recurvatus]
MVEAVKECPVDHTKLNLTEKSFQSSVDSNGIKEQRQKCPIDDNQLKQEESKCPVDHNKINKEQQKYSKDPSLYKHFIPPTTNKEEPQTCPVDPSTYKNFLPSPKEGCDSESLDRANNMPKLSQQSQPDQKIPLSVEREISTIPRANSEERLWIYPSEQMFFNAMRRKNWNPDERDMAAIVPIHNAVNEMAWQKILEWEKMHTTECKQPMLERFEGRPKDVTPKARIRSWFGYALPFDRHDWVVDRCGEKVTYVIDFYTGKQDPNKPMSLSFYLDVRPAVTVSGLWDRLKMSFKKGEFI